MVILKFRTEAETKDMLKKVRKMYKFAKELKDCLEEKVEDYDEEEDYRYDDDEDEHHEMMENRRNGGSYRRYRRSM